jgi:DNA-binding response OmpR family regulator
MEDKSRVLIVDDNIPFAKSLSDILSMKGWKSIVANDGEEAIEKVGEDGFDVILLDIRLPGIDGVEACKKIKKIKPESVVIMMTAFSQDEIV